LNRDSERILRSNSTERFGPELAADEPFHKPCCRELQSFFHFSWSDKLTEKCKKNQNGFKPPQTAKNVFKRRLF